MDKKETDETASSVFNIIQIRVKMGVFLDCRGCGLNGLFLEAAKLTGSNQIIIPAISIGNGIIEEKYNVDYIFMRLINIRYKGLFPDTLISLSTSCKQGNSLIIYCFIRQ